MHRARQGPRVGGVVQVLPLVLAAVLLTGCHSDPHAGPCLVDIDVTASTQQSRMVGAAWVQPFVNRVVAGCHDQAIDASLITSNSKAELCPDASFPEPGRNGNPLHDQGLENERRAHLKSGLNRLMACGLSHRSQDEGTDLFGAFAKAGDTARGQSGTRLYVLSDMIEDKDGWDFYTRSFGSAANHALLAQVKRAGLMASGLHGVMVTIIGSGVGARRISPAALAGVQAFWQRYFAEVGARAQYPQTGAVPG